jgi:hypothetical protein
MDRYQPEEPFRRMVRLKLARQLDLGRSEEDARHIEASIAEPSARGLKTHTESLLQQIASLVVEHTNGDV